MGDPTPPELQEWVAAVVQRLDLDLAGSDQDTLVTAVLDLTAHVAHGVSRPAAPVTAFLVGIAVAIVLIAIYVGATGRRGTPVR